MSEGIRVLQPGNITQDVFDSSRPRLQIDTEHTPPLLDVIQRQTTALVSNVGNGFFSQETLFSINHGLGYSPKVFLYIFTSSGGYACGQYNVGSGAFDDKIIYKINSTSFTILHVLDDTFANLGVISSLVTTAQLKYMLCSNPIDNYTDPALR